MNESGNLEDIVSYLEEVSRDSENLYPVERDVLFKVDSLIEADKHICQVVPTALKLIETANNKIQAGDLVVRGSCAEGCMLARWFRGRSLAETAKARGNSEDSLWEIELDVVGNIGSIPNSSSTLLETVESDVTHVRIPYCPQIRACVQDRLWTKIQHQREDGMHVDLDSDGYFDAFKIKKEVGILSIFRDKKNHLPIVLSWAFNKPVEDVHVSIKSETSKTSHQFTFKTQITDKISFNVGADLVAAFSADFWPNVAMEWVTRNRRWPDFVLENGEHIVQSIINKGSELVPRCSDERGDTKDFRWSFTYAEKTLTSLMSDHQRKCYFVMKMMFYRYVKPLHDDLKSYMAKTVMLWVCEEYPPDDKLWNPNDFLGTICYLLQRLENCFQSKFLPMYFIRKANLFEGRIPPSVCDAAAERIANIRDNLVFLIPFDIPDVISSAKTQAIAAAKMIEIAELTSDKLMGIVLELFMRPIATRVQPEAYNFDQCYQREVATFLLFKKLKELTEKKEEHSDKE